MFEVGIESKCSTNTEALRHDFAGAICETPILIIVTLKCFPCERDVILGERVNFREGAVEKLFPEQQCPSPFTACPE